MGGSGGQGEIRTHDLCLRTAALFAAGDWTTLMVGQGDRFAALPAEADSRAILFSQLRTAIVVRHSFTNFGRT
jgi:hypothetical protein